MWRTRNNKYLLFLTVIISGLLLFLALRGVKWNEIFETVKLARFKHLILACVIGSVAYIFRSLRWRVLLSAEKLLSPITVFYATMVGYLGNSFLPARSGELIRSSMLGHRCNIRKSYVLSTAISERIFDVIILVMILLIAILTVEELPEWLAGSVKLIGLIGGLCLVILIVLPQLRVLFKRFLLRLPLPGVLTSHISDVVEQFLNGVCAFQQLTRLLSFTCLTVVIWSTDALGATVVARAFDLSLSFIPALIFLSALGLASTIPSTPGYIGTFQFVAVSVLPAFGFTRSQALTYIIVLQASGYCIMLIWGIFGLWRLGVKGKL